MQMRPLADTGIEVSLLGFGGIVVMDRPQDEADREVAAAFDRGIRYFDVAPQYGDAQQRLGPALKPYREQVTLACKTLQRTAGDAAAELEDSLTKLRTDCFDIYQMHALSSMDDIDTALGEGGAIETFLDAKAAGKIRLIGFSAHDEQAALKAIASGHFDTMLVPLNYVTWHHGGFGPEMYEAARQRGMGILALKAMARGKVAPGQDKPYAKCWYEPEDRPEIAEKLLRWTLSLEGVAAAIPPGNPKLFHMALEFADRYAPISDDQTAELSTALAEAEPIFSSGQTAT